jgi:hypothetical protein
MAISAGALPGRSDSPAGKLKGGAQGGAIRVTLVAVRAAYERRRSRQQSARIDARPHRKED